MTPAPSANSSFDPGLTRQYSGPLLRRHQQGRLLQRAAHRIAQPGRQRLHRPGEDIWPRFLSFVTAAYLVMNGIFAAVFLGLGPGALSVTARDLDWAISAGRFSLASRR